MKNDIFSGMFIRAINWDVVNENVDAIAAVLLHDDDDAEKETE